MDPIQAEKEATDRLPQLWELLKSLDGALYLEAIGHSWRHFSTIESLEDETDDLMRRIKKTNAFTPAELTVIELCMTPK
jgi:hypothetical protein